LKTSTRIQADVQVKYLHIVNENWKPNYESFSLVVSIMRQRIEIS